jgi:hypothetical protein
MWKLEFILLTVTLIFVCLFEGAQSSSPSRIDVRGAITSVTRAEGEGRGKVLAHVFIEGAKEPDTQVDKASVTAKAERAKIASAIQSMQRLNIGILKIRRSRER